MQRGRFCQIRNETAGAGIAESRTASFHPDQFASCDPALPVENEHRDDGVLGRRTGRRAIIRFPITEVPGTRIGRATTAASITPIRQHGAIIIPVAFIPRQNPFYCALPYNDVTHGQFKPEAPLVIPWFKQAYTGQGQSVCWHRWIAIRKGNRTCYAQWEDCGPFRTDHFQYVFGNERPKPNLNHGAGLDVSPAVRDYLGLAPTDVTDWQFVEVRDVPPGPWRSYGENNHFVIARSKTEQRMADRNVSAKK